MTDYRVNTQVEEFYDDELDVVASDSVEEGDEMYEHFSVVVDKGQ